MPKKANLRVVENMDPYHVSSMGNRAGMYDFRYLA